MATGSHRFTAVPAALLTFAALASCGEGASGDAGESDASGGTAQTAVLFPDDFKGVCSDAGVARAAAYDAAATGHKILYFITYKDDFTDQSSSLPGDWTVQWSPDGDALTAIDLVVCARRTAAQQVKICDGYEDDGAPTDNQVRWHTATYEVSVREARTGTTLAQTTMEATDTDCPMLQMFNDNSETVDGYDSLSDTVVADFIRPYLAG
jgi:hypothetical protein